MNKRYIFWTIILLVSLCSCNTKTVDKDAQDRNDSIQKYLELADNDKVFYDKRIDYNDKAYAMINLNRNNDTVSISLLHKTAVNFHKFNEMSKLKAASGLMLKSAFLLKDDYWTGLSYKVLGLYYLNKSDNEKALYYFFKARKKLIRLNKHKEIIYLLFNISLTQNYAGDFLGSNKTAFKVLEMQKRYKSNLDYEVTLNQIANNLSNLNQDDKAIKYYNKINKKKLSLRFKNTLTNNTCLSYIELGEYQKAYVALDSIRKNKDLKKISPTGYAISLSLLGYCKLKMNNLSDLPGIFFEADEIFKKNKSINGMNYNQLYLSMYYNKIKDINNAIASSKKALKLSREYSNPADILFSLKQLIIVDKPNASKNAQEYIQVNNRLQIAERNFRDKYARIVYETKEISLDRANAIKHKWIIVALAGVVILIIALLLIITSQRSKQNRMQFQESQLKANEEIYDLMFNQKTKEDSVRQSEKKRIAIELHDGVMNRLASTRLNLNILSYQKDEETINKCLSYIEGIYEIEQEIRNIAHDLNTEIFNESNSFVTLLNDFVATQNATTSSKYQIEIDADLHWNHIASGIKMNLYRIIQEASHNSNKYAQATKVKISLFLDKNNICLSVTDNGKGFDTNANSEGIGLKNIKLRVESLKGKVVIKSNKKSTSINITIPLATV